MNIKVQKGTPQKVKRLVMTLLDILDAVGIPMDQTERRLERMAKACLAVGQIKTDLWEAVSASEGSFYRTRDIIVFENEHYGEHISPVLTTIFAGTT